MQEDGIAVTLTLKKSNVDPDPWMPYFILSCLTRSSTEFIFVLSFSNVRNAARFAVYDDMVIRVKNHQALAKTRPESDLKKKETITDVPSCDTETIDLSVDGAIANFRKCKMHQNTIKIVNTLPFVVRFSLNHYVP